MIKLTVNDLQKLSEVKSETDLYDKAKKDKTLSLIAQAYKAKIAERSKIKVLDYVAQKSQSIIKDNCFVIDNSKFTSSKSFIDSVAIHKLEVIKLQNLKLTYDSFKKLFVNVAKYVLCNANIKHNLAKHERFYSQCLAEVNQILIKRFTESIIHSRSKKIKVKQVTHDNVTKLHDKFMTELQNTDKVKSKTSKLIKAKSKKSKKVIA